MQSLGATEELVLAHARVEASNSFKVWSACIVGTSVTTVEGVCMASASGRLPLSST